MHRFAAAAALAASVPFALAQTSTSCNPTEKTCSADSGLSSDSYTVDFTSGSSSNASWSAATGTTIDYTSDGAVFSISSSGQAPTISTDFYFFFGRVDVVMKAAPGTGIVSSVVLESDDLDEIDWEFIGGSNGQVQSDFFGKGNTTAYDRVEYHDVSDTQGTWHTYSVDWTSERLEWLIDDVVVRTLPYSDALTVYGKNYPQTPMRVKLGNWCGGCSSSAGTVSWAGGKTSFDDAPYEMTVKSVSVTNNNPACSYEYDGTTGSYDSIKVITSGDSCSVSTATSSTTASSGSTTASSGSSTTLSTVTTAPTSSLTVQAISAETGVVATSTIEGSAYSTNTAGISSINSASTSGVSNATTNATSTASTSSVAVSTGGASSITTIAASGSLLTVALSFFLL